MPYALQPARMAIALEKMDFQSALAAVTGTLADLRAAASPAGGWIPLAQPSDHNWLNISGLGTTFVAVDLNDAAAQTWSDAIGKVEDIDQEVFAGKYGLMDVQQLRNAATTAGALAKDLGDATSYLSGIIGPLQNQQAAISGSAADALLTKLTEI